MSLILRSLTTLAAPAGAKSRLSVFYFHRVLETPDPLLPYEPDARMFDRMLDWIGSQFRVLDPLEACERLYDGSLPSRPAVITFDDGYRDNVTVALPILQMRGMKAAFFVATGFLNGGMMFNDRVIEAVRRASGGTVPLPGSGRNAAAPLPVRDASERRSAIDTILSAIKHLPIAERIVRVEELERSVSKGTPPMGLALEPLMMRPDHVLQLHHAGMTIGGHTRSHPILLALPDLEAEREILGGIDDLAGITGVRPRMFAYPNGKPCRDFDRRHVAMIERSGCQYAFTTSANVASANTPRYEIPRFTPWDRTPIAFKARAVANLMRARLALPRPRP